MLLSSSAEAQDRPSAALLATTALAGLDGDAAGFDRVLRAELGGLERVRVHGSATLRLEDVQLALGCEGETQACLGAVAREIGVRYLLLPNLDRIGSETVLSVALYDAEADVAPRRIARRASGADASATLVGEVGGLLRELFGEAGEAPPDRREDEPDEPEPDEPSEPEVIDQEPAASAGPDDGRVATAGVMTFVGVGALGLGIGFGVSTLERQDAYERTPVVTEDDAAEAGRRLVQAREDALTANVLLIAGGVVGAAGLAWLIAEFASGGGSSDVAVVPSVGPHGGGLAVAGVWR